MPTGTCFLCDLRNQGVFSCLQRDQLRQMEREKTARRYRRGQAIFYEGDPPFAVYCIHSGRVKLFKLGGRAEPQVTRLLGPGETVGYRAVLANEPYEATAEAVEPSLVCVVPKATLFALLRLSPDLAFAFMAKLSRELRASEEQLLLLSQESVRQRTAHLLLMLWEGGGEDAALDPVIKPVIQRKEMAQMVGTTPETLSRVLSQLDRCGVLSVTRSEIRVKDPSTLRKVAKARFSPLT